MIYLRKFKLLDNEEEFAIGDGRRIHNSSYPIGFFSSKEFKNVLSLVSLVPSVKKRWTKVLTLICT